MKNTPLLILLLLFFSTNSKAAHIIGGELNYTCIGSGDYNFLLTLYRDCNSAGANFDSAPGAFTVGTVTIFDASGLVWNIIDLDAPLVDVIDISPPNVCSAIPDLCIERGQYLFNVQLPVSNESYFVVYQRCCRNTTLTNIITPSQSGMTFVQEIKPVAQTICNSAPFFTPFNEPVVCTNETFNIDHGAQDTEGDQLIYSFCSPIQGGSMQDPAPNPDLPPPYDPVPYILPTYFAQQPLGSTAMMTIDSLTGVISGTPDFQGQFVVGICIDEYRNGEILSNTRRDFQLNVITCDSATVVDTLYANVNAGDIYQSVLIANDTTLFFESESQFGCDSLSVHIVSTQPMGVTENKSTIKVELFPNPVAEELTIAIQSDEPVYSAKIYTPNGLQKVDLAPENWFSKKTSINTSGWSPGLYFLMLQTSAGIRLEKFVKY